MKKLLFVYNPHSGKGRIGDSLSDILCTFTGAGYNVTAHPTSYARDGENFIKQHAKEFNLVVVGLLDRDLDWKAIGVLELKQIVACQVGVLTRCIPKATPLGRLRLHRATPPA